jgi:glutaredoxin
MLKSYLQHNKIAYEEKHADQDQSIALELYQKSGQLGVPFTIIGQISWVLTSPRLIKFLN